MVKIMPTPSLTHERVLSILSYDPETGLLTWMGTRGRCVKGKRAGSQLPNGAFHICVDRKIYLVHRLIWFYMTRKWPEELIDHRDLDPSNNRWGNLREAKYDQNTWNSGAYSTNKLGLKGIRKTKYGKFSAKIYTNGIAEYLGTYDCPAAAHLTYALRAAQTRGEFGRVNDIG